MQAALSLVRLQCGSVLNQMSSSDLMSDSDGVKSDVKPAARSSEVAASDAAAAAGGSNSEAAAAHSGDSNSGLPAAEEPLSLVRVDSDSEAARRPNEPVGQYIARMRKEDRNAKIINIKKKVQAALRANLALTVSASNDKQMRNTSKKIKLMHNRLVDVLETCEDLSSEDGSSSERDAECADSPGSSKVDQ